MQSLATTQLRVSGPFFTACSSLCSGSSNLLVISSYTQAHYGTQHIFKFLAEAKGFFDSLPEDPCALSLFLTGTSASCTSFLIWHRMYSFFRDKFSIILLRSGLSASPDTLKQRHSYLLLLCGSASADSLICMLLVVLSYYCYYYRLVLFFFSLHKDPNMFSIMIQICPP